MLEEKKEVNNEEFCEEVTALSMEELEQVSGGMITGAAQMDGAILVIASDDVSAR